MTASMYQLKEEWEQMIAAYPYLDPRIKKLMGKSFYLGCMTLYNKFANLGVQLRDEKMTVAGVMLQLNMMEEELTEFALKTLEEIK